jgi:mono/diheme cytochrome c family protein
MNKTLMKRQTLFPITIAALTLLLTAAAQVTAQADPGLIAAYSDGKHTVSRVVPSPSFTLAANESVHSQIAPNFNVVYSGVLSIVRGGEYTLSGDAGIAVDGKDASGKIVKLSAGDHALTITYRRKAGPARLQLRWKSNFFIEEPIPPSAFAHAGVVGAPTKQWASIEQGRSLYENLSCGACHGASGWNLSVRRGPDLSDIGSRATADWLSVWLKNPHAYRKDAVMPVLLTADKEITDAAAFLSTLMDATITGTATGTAPAANPKRIATGKELFERVGCSKCHSETKNSLASVGSKFKSSQALAGYLADPLHVDPSGRMPAMFDAKTQADEAAKVAEFLFHTKKSKAVWPKHAEGGDALRGRGLIESRGCVSCHAIKQGGKLLADKTKSPQFTARSGGPAKNTPLVVFDPNKGCLAAVPGKTSPHYKLSVAERASLRAFMTSTVKQPVVAKAPVETFYRRVSQFNCTACHALNDQNNGPAQMVTDDGKVVSIERPPSLTAAGDKLQVSWLHNVLVKKKRARPWMKMRMPHFGSEMASLPGLFPAASGSELVDKTPPPKIDIAEAGLKTIGTQRGQTSCITCHNYRGINNQKEGVVPAPDMAEIGKTLRHDWFRRWLHNPPRMAPGTSMPQFFLTLKGDEREQKIDELWAALVHQARLPLPKGLIDVVTEGTRIVVGDDPVLFRASTKIPKAQIDRAINVGLPGGTNFTFDAATARLRYAWKGDFINAGAAWNGRGGNPVSAQGASLYIAPSHFPLRIGSSSADPKVRFLGYYLVEKYPVFRYSVDGVEVHERIAVSDTKLVRRFTIEVADKPVSFIGDKTRKYTSSKGEFKDGVLTIPAGKKIEFEVETTLTAGRAEVVKPLKWIAASAAKPPKSKSGGPGTSVTFENKSKRRIKVVWIGYGGETKVYSELKSGGTHRQDTYGGSTWMIADENDKPLGHFIATAKASRAVIPGAK